MAPVTMKAVKAKALLSSACVAMLLYAAELLVKEAPDQEEVEGLYQQLVACRDAFDACLGDAEMTAQPLAKEA